MKNVEDLLTSARTVCARYQAGRMERETVREWVLRLGEYPSPYAERIALARQWFAAPNPELVTEEMRATDMERLSGICAS